jgi:nitrite reductase/ring-hydroxylating ferredoxin subunit
VATLAVIIVAVAFALGPQTPPNRPPGEIALVGLGTLGSSRVVRVTVKELVGLDGLADAERRGRGQLTITPPRTHPQGMPVFVVRAHDGVRAFLGVDPRTGCALENKSARFSDAVAFVDVCHGTGYDLDGRPTRGPGMWSLDELVLQVRAGVVYAVVGKVVAGGVAAR